MAQYNSFEDLPIWQEARLLTKEVYRITSEKNFARDQGLKSQIQRASVSVMSNIAEGFERQTDKDKVQFFNYAKASIAEVRSQLFVALDVGYISEAIQEKLNEEFKSLAAQIAGFMKYLSK